MKGKITRKVLAFLLTLAMVVTYMPAFALTVFAGSTQPKTLTADSQEGFESACSEAVSGDTIQLGNGEFAIGPVDINGKTLTFKGNGASETKIYIGNGGYDGNGGHGSNKTANMTFENVTLDDLASDSGYLTGFTEAAGLTFRNVTFNVGFSNWGNKGGGVSFYNCTFNQNADGKYNVQELRSANGTKFLFDGCTFNSTPGRFINAYKQGGSEKKIEIIVKDCSFKGNTESKSAVNMKTGNNGCTIDLYLLGENTTDKVKVNSATGSALFMDEEGTCGTVYQGATKETAVKIWENGAKVETKKLPQAEVTTYDLTKEKDLAELAGIVGQDGFPICDFSNGVSLSGSSLYTLQIPDCAYKFAATEEAGTSDYGNWYADYTVSFDKPVAKDSMGLVGYYGSYGFGLGFLAPMEVHEDVEVPLLNTAMDISGWTYDDIIKMVGEFYCGAFNLSSANNDTTMTVKLRIFDPEVFNDPDNIQNQNLYKEGVNTYTIEEIQYKLTKNGAIPKDGVNYTVAGTADENSKIPEGKFYIHDGVMVKAESDVSVEEKTAYFTDGKSVIVVDNDSKAVKTKQTSSIGEEDIPEEVKTAISSIKSEIETATKVSGVELTTEGEDSGVQAIVNKAFLSKANEDERSAIRSATELEVKVNVVVTPKGYTENQTLKFDLTPVATVIAKDESGNQTAKVEGVEVTNDMIDQTQNITVSVFSDFEPKTVLHVADNGETTSYTKGLTPSGSTFTYDESAKKVSLLVHHFSDILLYNEEYVARIGDTPYKTFEAALKDVKDNETITMLKDCDFDVESPTVMSSNNVTLNMNGKKVTVKGNFIRVTGSMTVTGNGEFDWFDVPNDNPDRYKGYLFLVTGNGQLTLENGKYSAYGTIAQAGNSSSGGSVYIKNGEYTCEPGTYAGQSWMFNKMDGSQSTIKISGGIFQNFDPMYGHTEAPEESFLADGYTSEAVEGQDGTFRVVRKKVAKIGDVKYETLQKAFDAAEAGQTVQLIENVDITENGLKVETNKDIILDLNNHSIKTGEQHSNNIQVEGKLTLIDSVVGSTGKIYTEEEYSRGAADKGVIFVSGEFVMNSGKIEAYIPEDTDNKGQFGVNLNQNGKVTINGGEIEAGWQTIATNGNEDRGDTEIVVNGGTLISTNDYSISNPAKRSKVTVTGGTIYGATGGIAMIQGTLNVTGGVITSKDQGSTGTWGDGTGKLGNAAISIGKDQTGYGDVTATISGGKISAEGDAVVINKVSGTYGYKLSLTATGGYYSSDVSNYVAEGYSCVSTDETDVDIDKTIYTHKVVKNPVAQIGDVEYTTLAAAIAAVPEGVDNATTITMIGNETIIGNDGVTIPANKNIVLDLNGYTVKNAVNKNAWSQVIENKGVLTIDDSSEAADGVMKNELMEGVQAGDWWSDPQRNWATNVITNKGNLTVENGIVFQTINESICYAIDTSNNFNAELIINGGSVLSECTAIRLWPTEDKEHNLTVTGGYIYGAGRGIQLHSAGKSTVNISGGSIITKDNAGYAFMDLGAGVNQHYNFFGGVFGGEIFTYGADMTISDGTFNSTVYPNGDSQIIGGTFNEEVISYLGYYDYKGHTCSITGGEFNNNVYVYDYHGDKVSVSGGRFALDLLIEFNSDWDHLRCITGGVFAFDSYSYNSDMNWISSIADGYEKVANTDPETMDDYPWTVGVKKVIPEVKKDAPEQSQTASENTVKEKLQRETLTSTEEEAIKKAIENAISNISGNKEIEKVETKGNEKVNTQALVEKHSKEGVPESDRLQGIYSSHDTTVIVELEKVEVTSVKQEAQALEFTIGKAVYEVTPKATVTTTITDEEGTRTETKTITLTNEDLKEIGAVKVRLAVPHTEAGYAMVTHESQDATYPTEYFTTRVLGYGDEQYVEIDMTHFSTVTVKTMEQIKENKVAMIAKAGEVEYYDTLAEAIAAVESGQTISILKDCNSNGISVKDKDTFAIDFGGHTVTFDKPGAGSAGTKTQALQLLAGQNITLKNGTIECSSSNRRATWKSTDTEKGIAMVIQNYCNLTLDNMHIDGYNIAHNGENTRYVVSNNSGNVEIYNSTIDALDGDIALDTCKYGTYAPPTVNVTGASNIYGDVDATGGELNLKGKTNLEGEIVSTDGDEAANLAKVVKEKTAVATEPEGYMWSGGENGNLIPIAAMIGDTKYATLKDAFEAVGDQETPIKVMNDIVSEGISVPSGKNITLDLNGKKVSFDGPGAGSSGTRTIGLQLLKDSTIVIKNGKLDMTDANKDKIWEPDSEDKGIAMLIQNYADLTLENVEIDGANVAHNRVSSRYVMSNNSGNVVLNNAKVTVNDNDIAFDTCKFGNYEIPKVKVEGNSTIDGDIALGGGNLELASGTLNGNLKNDGIGTGTVTKAASFQATAPEGYKWNENNVLVPIVYVAQIVKKTDTQQGTSEVELGKYESLLDASVAAAKSTEDNLTIRMIANDETADLGNAITTPSNAEVDFNNKVVKADYITVYGTIADNSAGSEVTVKRFSYQDNGTKSYGLLPAIKAENTANKTTTYKMCFSQVMSAIQLDQAKNKAKVNVALSENSYKYVNDLFNKDGDIQLGTTVTFSDGADKGAFECVFKKDIMDTYKASNLYYKAVPTVYFGKPQTGITICESPYIKSKLSIASYSGSSQELPIN